MICVVLDLPGIMIMTVQTGYMSENEIATHASDKTLAFDRSRIKQNATNPEYAKENHADKTKKEIPQTTHSVHTVHTSHLDVAEIVDRLSYVNVVTLLT